MNVKYCESEVKIFFDMLKPIFDAALSGEYIFITLRFTNAFINLNMKQFSINLIMKLHVLHNKSLHKKYTLVVF